MRPSRKEAASFSHVVNRIVSNNYKDMIKELVAIEGILGNRSINNQCFGHYSVTLSVFHLLEC